MNKKKKILVTGGCGYIGSHVAVDLLNKGYEVVSIDNFINSDPWVLDAIKEITGVKMKNYEVDIRDENVLKEIFKQEDEIDAVIHFAALKAVGESVEKPLKYFDFNVTGLISLLKNLPESVNTFVFSSSCTVYGMPDRFPVDETFPMGETESPYGTTKKISEMVLSDTIKNNADYNLVVLRYFNPAGAHDSGKLGEKAKYQVTNLVPVIMETAAGKRDKLTVYGDDYVTRDGSCVRDYIHIMDLAEAHTKSVNYGESMPSGKKEIFNLGVGEGVTVLEAIKAFEKSVRNQLNYEIGDRRVGDIPKIYADPSKAKKLLNWEATRSIEDIMRTAWEWERGG